MGLYRGNYRLAHMSQVLGRDETAKEIGQHLGGKAMGYALTEEQHREREEMGRGGLPYRFLVYSPSSCALSWTAFYTREAMQSFLTAYGCTLDVEPVPGGRFYILFPESADAFQPLVVEKRVTFETGLVRNVGFLMVDADTPDEANTMAREWLNTKADEIVKRLTLAEAVSLGENLYRVRLQ